MKVLTQEIKRHAVIVVLAAKHNDLKILAFYMLPDHFHKVWLELERCDGNVSPIAKRKSNFNALIS